MMSEKIEIKGIPLLPEMPTGARWTPQRKEAIVMAINYGSASVQSAVIRYREHGLSADEIEEWRHSYAMYGFRGLKTSVRTKVVEPV